ncbi:outer membrane protein [Legionella shakespearei]|uniref:Surface antigen n=1 Tax=Legionella shakespearei DSM 23087 TaxID=1122169 RepID=A0A0W0Z931_9GAMM|nr:outer membrane beta-barrel protein [Legionella shakespearei]KTD65636.1 Surface antigen [Legionella shakespearei DSM 23087]
MKQFIYAGLLSNLLLPGSSFALNLVNGFYVGAMGEMSTGPSSHQTVFREDHELFTGTVKNSPIGGGGGGMLGYRYEGFRLEGELLFNWNSTGPLTVGSCTLQSPNVVTPTGYCPQDHFLAKQLGFKGSIGALYGMINAYYDFIRYDVDNPVFPYIGAGIGHARVRMSGNFVNTNTGVSHTESITSNGAAAQGILGVGMFMDDFAWIGMDYRYLTTNTIKEIENKRYAINTLNFNVGMAFDKGGL